MMLMRQVGLTQIRIDKNMTINQATQPNTIILGDNTNPIAFFDAVYQSFQKARQFAGGPPDRFYGIAGYTIRLRFAGAALEPRITPALEHTEAKPCSNPSLTICLWDDASTHTTMPSPPWLGYGVHNPYGDLLGVYTRRGEVRGYNNNRIHTAFHMGADVLNMLDQQRNLGVYWTPDASHLPIYETGSPLRTILHWWSGRHGRQFLHCGAVGTAKGGVLLLGKGGSGKSTTALSCLNSRLSYVSDDYCLVETEPAPYVYNLYNTAKLSADGIQLVPHLKQAISNVDRLQTEKALFFLHRCHPKKIVAGFPVRALLMPRVTGGFDTMIKAASPAAALSALAPSTMNQLAGAGAATLQVMKRLVDQVPCYHLELGTDSDQIPRVISKLLGNA